MPTEEPIEDQEKLAKLQNKRKSEKNVTKTTKQANNDKENINIVPVPLQNEENDEISKNRSHISDEIEKIVDKVFEDMLQDNDFLKKALS